jgi:hypothetical protein
MNQSVLTGSCLCEKVRNSIMRNSSSFTFVIVNSAGKLQALPSLQTSRLSQQRSLEFLALNMSNVLTIPVTASSPRYFALNAGLGYRFLTKMVRSFLYRLVLSIRNRASAPNTISFGMIGLPGMKLAFLLQEAKALQHVGWATAFRCPTFWYPVEGCSGQLRNLPPY